MHTRIRFYWVLAFFVLFAGIASAHPGLKVEKKAISVTPPSSSGHVVVWGPPGSVRSTAPVNVKVYNKARKIMRGGVVAEDGSFAVSAIGYDGDKLKVRFVSWNGRGASVRLKVPEKPSPPPVETLIVAEETEVTGVSADEEEAESVEEVLAPPPVVDVEPAIPAVEEGTETAEPMSAVEGEPVVPETLPPSPILEERLVETGDLEPPDLEAAEEAASDAVPTDASAADEEAESVEEVLAPPPVVDVEPVIPSENGPMGVAESEPIVPETLPAPPPIEEKLVEPAELDARPVELDVEELEIETTSPPPAGEAEPPATMESGASAPPIEEKTPAAE